MKQILGFSILAIYLISCASLKAQTNANVNQIAKKHFAVLQHVADGKKNKESLNIDEIAFLLLISDWSRKAEGISYGESRPKIDKGYVAAWKNWYKSHSSQIDEQEFTKTLALYKQTWNSDKPWTEEEEAYIIKVSKKYAEL